MTEKREEKRYQIFEKALDLFARYGFKKTTIADVADAMGMTKGNLYFYVKNKQDLYAKTIHWALTQWQDRVREAVDKAPTPPEKFLAMARAAFSHIEKSPTLQQLLTQDPDIFTLDRDQDRFPQANAAALGIIREILDLGIREKVFFVPDPDAVARHLFTIYMMFLIQSYVFLEKKDVHRIFEAALDLNLRGLMSPQILKGDF